MNLTSLEHEILRLHNRLSLTTTVEDAWRIGELLAQGKEQLAHGDFLPWVRRMGLSVRSAQEYMVVYRHFDKAQHAAHLSLRGFLAGWRRAKRAACLAEFGANREAAERASRNAQPDPWIRHADAYTFPGWPSGINIIATDPPWQDDRAYEWLASMAVDKLTDQGILLVQVSTGDLPQRLQVFLDAGLSYRWTLAIVYSQMTYWTPGHILIQNWRPVLVFSKGKWPGCPLTTDTMTIFHSSKKSKIHPWEQPLQPWLKWLQALSRPGQLVCDPFCGTGTIAVAVKMLGEERRFLGTEKELTTARLAWSRLRSVD
jgi:hypothetical protein